MLSHRLVYVLKIPFKTGNQRPRKQTPSWGGDHRLRKPAMCWLPRVRALPSHRGPGLAVRISQGKQRRLGEARAPARSFSGECQGRLGAGPLLSDGGLHASFLPHCQWATEPSQNMGRSGHLLAGCKSLKSARRKQRVTCYRPARRAVSTHGHRLHGGRFQLRIRKNILDKQPICSGLKGGPKRYTCILIYGNRECDLIWKKSRQTKSRLLT